MSEMNCPMPPLRGPELLRAAINQILAHPDTWDQQTWHCGTTHCVGGWCQLLGGRSENSATANDDARDLLGLSRHNTNWLFDGHRTIYEIYSFAKQFLSGGGYDRGGYDRDGYDRGGYDRDGYDRGGYDRGGKKLELLPL